MTDYSWQEFLKETSDLPRHSDGTIDYTAAFMNIVIPQRQLIRLVMNLLHLIQAKAPNRSKWKYVTSWSLSETLGEAVNGGVFMASSRLNDKMLRGAENE
jgi:hypothetical protein